MSAVVRRTLLAAAIASACTCTATTFATACAAASASADESPETADAIATALLVTEPPVVAPPAPEGPPPSLPALNHRRGHWAAVGFGTGPVQWDANLADYQWDVRPRIGWGAHAFAGAGRFGLGVRMLEARTRQSLGDGMTPITVIARSFEVAGNMSVVSFHGADLIAGGSVGQMNVAWTPRHTTLAAPGAPIEVDFAPIDAWTIGFGLGVERSLGGPWLGRVTLDRRAFGWDTAHRAGDAIEVGRESFGNWSARFEVDWVRVGR